MFRRIRLLFIVIATLGFAIHAKGAVILNCSEWDPTFSEGSQSPQSYTNPAGDTVITYSAVELHKQFPRMLRGG